MRYLIFTLLLIINCNAENLNGSLDDPCSTFKGCKYLGDNKACTPDNRVWDFVKKEYDLKSYCNFVGGCPWDGSDPTCNPVTDESEAKK